MLNKIFPYFVKGKSQIFIISKVQLYFKCAFNQKAVPKYFFYLQYIY